MQMNLGRGSKERILKYSDFLIKYSDFLIKLKFHKLPEMKPWKFESIQHDGHRVACPCYPFWDISSGRGAAIWVPSISRTKKIPATGFSVELIPNIPEESFSFLKSFQFSILRLPKICSCQNAAEKEKQNKTKHQTLLSLQVSCSHSQ